MSGSGGLVRALRPATDLVAPFSFNRVGFAWNRRGFVSDDLAPVAANDRRVAVVTGANSGIGRAAASELLQRGFEVWLLCRDEARGAEARDALAREHGSDHVHLALVDLASLGSIERCVAGLSAPRVDVVVHNAGMLPHEKQLSADGVELTFATHVLGPYALTMRLGERLRRSSDARVIFVASGGLYLARLDLALPDVEPARFDGTLAYANAKRAQVVLARLLSQSAAVTDGRAITFASMHPGWVDTAALRTSLPRFYRWMRPWLRSPAEGADTIVWLASAAQPRGTLGELWFDRRVAPQYPLPWTRESAESRLALAQLCQRLSGIAFDTPKEAQS